MAAASELLDYVTRRGAFEPTAEEDVWRKSRTTPPEEWWSMWRGLCGGELAKFATRVTRAKASTGSVERCFSTMGWQSEKRRNRLKPLNVHKLTTVYEHFRDLRKPNTWWDGLEEELNRSEANAEEAAGVEDAVEVHEINQISSDSEYTPQAVARPKLLHRTT